jgi:transposase
MAGSRHTDGKEQSLRARGSLHPKPERVTDPLFLEDPFFDPRDLVQVKYEMLRSVEQDGSTVRQASSAFGLSRLSFYHAKAAFTREGVAGLVAKKRGPRGRRKLTPEVLDFVSQKRREEPSLRWRALAEKVKERFGVAIHPRSLERVLGGSKKKPRRAR